jgi:predicted nuclease of predicted toxin-antitoxin system
MKFLFDQSADFRLIPHLQALGHDVAAISRNYPPGLADEDVLALARQEERILIVADRDFGEWIFHQGLAPASFSFGFQELPCKPRSNASIECLMNTLRSLHAVPSSW